VVYCVHLRGTNFYFTGKGKYKSSEYQPRHQLLTFPHFLMQPCDFLFFVVVVTCWSQALKMQSEKCSSPLSLLFSLLPFSLFFTFSLSSLFSFFLFPLSPLLFFLYLAIIVSLSSSSQSLFMK
jgi:hypothetical protein